MEIVTADVGGTHARFALASIAGDGTIELGEPLTLHTSDYPGLEAAWEDFARRMGGALPKAAALGLAGPVIGDTVKLTNNAWIIRIGALRARIGLERVTVLNDFGAVAHAAARASADQFIHLAGPDLPLPEAGTISVIGPGTGLGVAYFRRTPGSYQVQATEGAHLEFGPVDAFDDALLARLRQRHKRVSAERVVSGPGIAAIHALLSLRAGNPAPALDDRTIWEQGLREPNSLASAAIDRFCLSLGSLAGDFALVHGAGGVVIAGGLGYRIRERLGQSGFAARFRDKGRYERMMAQIPVKFFAHPQPGLLGAAAAFVQEHGLP